MSYVIQNFHDFNKKLTLTPRFKFFFILNNLEKFFIFIKLNTFFNKINISNIFLINHFFLFFKYFFAKQYIKLIFNSNLDFSGNYTLNLTKSFLFHIFFNFFNFFKNKNNNIKQYQFFNNYLFNLYFTSVKALNIRINNSFYKNFFFYLMLINSFIWYQHTSYLKFYLNFIFINYNLKTFRFYNGHFLKVYNF